MCGEEQTELKRLMRNSGVTIKAVAQRMRKPYSTIGGQLGGFTPLTKEVLSTIESMISEATQKSTENEFPRVGSTI